MVTINLLPPELKIKRLQAKHQASLISICLVVIIVAVVVGIIASSAKKTLEIHLGITQRDIDQANNEKSDKNLIDMALMINDRAQATAQVNKTRAIWSQVLQELSNSAPSDVQFESFSANSEKTPNFTLTGNTSSEREIIKFKDKLSASSFFKNVTFKNSTLSTTQDGPSRVRFSLDFDLAKFAAQSTSTTGGSQ